MGLWRIHKQWKKILGLVAKHCFKLLSMRRGRSPIAEEKNGEEWKTGGDNKSLFI